MLGVLKGLKLENLVRNLSRYNLPSSPRSSGGVAGGPGSSSLPWSGDGNRAGLGDGVASLAGPAGNVRLGVGCLDGGGRLGCPRAVTGPGSTTGPGSIAGPRSLGATLGGLASGDEAKEQSYGSETHFCGFGLVWLGLVCVVEV